MACHGNSVNNTNAIQTLRDFQMHMYPLSKFISIEVAVQELGWGGVTQPPLGQGVGQKHLGRARVKTLEWP